MKTYGGAELNLHAFWAWMLEAASSGHKFAITGSGKMKDKCSRRASTGTQCGMFHARQFYSWLHGAGRVWGCRLCIIIIIIIIIILN